MEASPGSFDLPVLGSMPLPAEFIGLHSEPLSGVSVCCSVDVRVLTGPGLRSNILSLYYEDAASSKQRAYASALSGAIAGGGVTRLMGR